MRLCVIVVRERRRNGFNILCGRKSHCCLITETVLLIFMGGTIFP